MGCCDGKKDIRGKGFVVVNFMEQIQYIGFWKYLFVVVGGVMWVQYFVDGFGELVKVYKISEVGVVLVDCKWFLVVDWGNVYQEYVELELEFELELEGGLEE